MAEGEYFRFCFNHVREYNKGFNYFSGLADGEIARLPEGGDDRPPPDLDDGRPGVASAARPISPSQRSGRAGYYNRMRDPFNLFGGRANDVHAGRANARPSRLRPRRSKRLALTQRRLAAAIKARYKELVKRHHPDANGGDRGSEDRFRDVLQAYRVLKQAGLC